MIEQRIRNIEPDSQNGAQVLEMVMLSKRQWRSLIQPRRISSQSDRHNLA
jgi:hypothetical protein